MIEFGNTLELYEEALKQERVKAKYKGDSDLFQEAKQSDSNDKGDTSEKYDDKYDLDNDQGTTIEPADVDVDDDFDYGSSEEEESNDEKKEETKDKKKSKKKKKSSKKKDVDEEEDGTEEEPSEEEADDDNTDRDDEIDVEEEGFKEGIKAELKSIPKDFKKGFNRYKDYYKQMGQDIKDNIQDIKDDGLKGLLNAKVNASVRRQDRLDDFNMRGIQDRKDSRHEILDAYKSKNKVDKFARDAKRNIGKGIRKAGEKIDDTLTESYRYQEAAELIKNHLKQDIDEEQESRVGENNYYTFITNSSKDLEHLYKTLMKRGSKEMIMEEMNNIFNELKERREKYFSSRKDEHSSDPKRSYQGLKRIIDQDIENIEKNIEQLSDPEQPKMNKSLMKKTIKMINNLQQDMITECQRSQPTIIRYARDVAKKLWLFEYNIEETDTEVTMESGEDAMLAKVGEMLVHLRKQKELQDLAEKSGVQINGMRYTDDTIMNIVTSMVSLMLAKEEGDPRYARLVDQGMQKRSLKVEIINAYKDKANDLINRYDHGPIVTAEPYNRDIEVISDEDQDIEEFYVDEYGEMHSSYYQEADDEDTKDPFYQLEQEIGKKLPSIYRKLIPTTLDPKEHVQEMAERFYDQKLKTNNKEYSEYTFGELYTVEDVLKHYGDHEGYLSFDEGDGFGNYALIKIDDWSVYLYIHDAPDGNKYVKIANSLNNLCHKLNISTDKVIDEYYQYYYQEAESSIIDELPQDYQDWLDSVDEKFLKKEHHACDDAFRIFNREKLERQLEVDDSIRSSGTDDEKDGYFPASYVAIARSAGGNLYLIKTGKKSIVYKFDMETYKMTKVASSWQEFLDMIEDVTEESWYYQESDEDDIEDEDSDEEDDDDDNEDIDDEDSDEDDEDDDDKEKENDDDDDAAEDDKELKDKEYDDDVEEFYIDETGRMRSTWYNEMDETYDGPGGASNSQRTKFKDTDEQIEWEVKPCKEVEDIEFGDERKKVLKKLTKDFGEPQHRDEEKDDYGKFIVYYENDKVSRVTILKDIQIELDRSIVFPGNADNIRKKALDLKPVGDGKLVSRVMSIEVKLNSDNTLESITFARRQYYTDQQYQKYDSVKWHIENGKTEKDAIKFFKEIYKFFEKHSLLTPDGREEMRSIGVNSVLNTNELTERGNQFAKIYYDRNRNCDYKTIRNTLEQCWTQFTSQTYTKGEKDSN